MGMNNIELLKLAQKYLGKGGSIFNQFCHSSGAWCCAYVTYLFHKGDDAKLFYGGKIVVYCPTAIKWASANLAQIPPYLALPMDIVFFDWNLNGVPNHIGFIRERKSCTEVYTIEGNTSGGIVAQKTRPTKYIQGIFRPHFKATYDISKPLTIDGYYGYSSIAMTQKALGCGVDGILGKATVKALQKWAGVAQDGSWGVKTSKAIQKKLGVTQDGYFGENSVKALQRWASNKVFPQPKTIIDKEMDACKVQAEWMKNYTYKWVQNPTINGSKKYGTCVTYVACVLQRIGILKSGQFIWHNGKGKVDGANSKMSVSYPGGTIKGNKSKLKKGDILLVGDKSSVGAGGNSHIMIFNGTWDSNNNPYVWDNQSATRVKKGKNGLHTYGGGKKIIAVVRLK